MKKHRLLLAALILLLMVPCTLALASKPNIPNNAITFNGHTYAVYKQACTWKDARKKCEKAGGHLVTISSETENNAVNRLVKALGKGEDIAWIGLWKSDVNADWRWVTGESLDFNYFPEYPSDYGYVYMEGYADGPYAAGMWHIAPPQESIYDELMWYYVCEWDTIPETVSAPKNVKASQPAANTIKLTWKKATNAKKYVIWRKDSSSSNYEKIGESKKLAYIDKKVKNGNAYKYKIQSVNGSKSSYSSAVNAYPLPKVANLKAKVSGKTNILLSWKKVKGAKHYYIYQKGPRDSKYLKLKIDTSATKIKIPVTTYFGKYSFYVVPAHGSFEGLKSVKTSITIKNPVVYRAVIVGQEKSGALYSETPGCGADRRAMASMLADLAATKYEIHSVISGSKSDILNAIDLVFSQADNDDVNLFFYSGHGDEGFLPFIPGPAFGGLVCNGGGTISPEELRKKCDQYKGKKVMIINACHSGQMIGKMSGIEGSFTQNKIENIVKPFGTAFARSDNDLAAKGYYVITSCSKNQTSTHYPTHTVFTYSLLQGLGWDVINNTKLSNLEADTNNDNQISLQEIYNYCHNQIDSSKMDVQVYPTNCSEIFFGR